LQTQAKALLELRDRKRKDAASLPKKWDNWLRYMFPDIFEYPFSSYHTEFWEWVECINEDSNPVPFITIWPRGSGKTTMVESAVVRLGARGVRRFCLYVRSNQDKANESISNIGTMIEGVRITKHYPEFSKRKMTKYGYARGWRIDALHCANGFSIIGLGLDAAVRGIKIEENRPDIIVFDDIDDLNDTFATIEKKKRTLTSSILPAGSANVAILGVQNLIHENSIFSMLSEGDADFLLNRKISGPYPAVRNLEYERVKDGYKITKGEATWKGQSLAICERQINKWGLTSFLREAQHEVEQTGGIWDHIEYRRCEFEEIPTLVEGAVWVDPAVTSTNESDSMGIIADGLGVDGKLYRLYAWEQITTPEKAIKRAILKCLEYGFNTVGIETDQGGDTWRPTYKWVWEHMIENGEVDKNTTMPKYKFAKAGSGHGGKAARNQRMLVSYEQGKVIHVIGTMKALERSLRRFPNKPLDLADAAYWGWFDLIGSRSFGGTAKRAKMPNQSNRRRNQNKRYVDEERNRALQKTLRYKGKKRFPLITQSYNWYIEPGWQKIVDVELANSIVNKFPKHFEVLE
jgi:hypothetical protein